jgi:Zn-dependent membrane protease YugP
MSEIGSIIMGSKIPVSLVNLFLIFLERTVVTLPVELDASRRAKKMLVAEGILRQEEMSGAEEVLSAAALTYLASMFTSLVYFLRFMFFVLRMFGNRRDD